MGTSKLFTNIAQSDLIDLAISQVDYKSIVDFSALPRYLSIPADSARALPIRMDLFPNRVRGSSIHKSTWKQFENAQNIL